LFTHVNRQLDRVRLVDADRPIVGCRHDQCRLLTGRMPAYPAELWPAVGWRFWKPFVLLI